MDHFFALKHTFPLIKLLHSIPVQVVDGQPISSGPICFETAPIPMHVGNHTELLSFYIIYSPHFPVILGLSWLRLHNPYINWHTETITFLDSPPENPGLILTSLAQAQHNLAPPTIPSPSSPSDSPPTLQLPSVPSPGPSINLSPVLPKKYADFQDVFDKKEADTLPIHCPYDCNIDLLPGTQPPWGPIYGLTEPEQVALKTYIDEMLAKGFIQHSKSPAGAPVFFIKKKDDSLHLCVDY